jgi:hypothetical protein
MCPGCRGDHALAEEKEPGYHYRLRREQDDYEQAQEERRQAQAKKRPQGK